MSLSSNPSASSSPNAAIIVHLPRSLHVSGCPVEGEVELDFRRLHEENINEVHLKLRGSAETIITRDRMTLREVIPLVHDDASLWTLGSVYPPPGSDTLRIPFRLQLPLDLPPSFSYAGLGRTASVRYSLTAVGTRPGTFHFNRRVRVPLAIVQKDTAGVRVREKLQDMTVGLGYPWRTMRREEKIRRGLWGDYATVQVQLMIPDLTVHPLFAPIPFVIDVKTITPPIARAQAEVHPPDKPVFPPVPSAFNMMQFKLQRKLHIRARAFTGFATSDDAALTKDAASGVTALLPEMEWTPLDCTSKKRESPGDKGTWIQRARFQSTFSLDCPHSFAIDNIRCEYALALKVPFPGIGNNLHIGMPITVSSGLDAPILREELNASAQSPSFLDLPPAYWDVNSPHWREEKD
ncbi:hypothetical protein BD414DRAFT_460256 [Trametes punicea]|nr:hypothetical protein BD414DRAFT_460256 [Trametes punicea]